MSQWQQLHCMLYTFKCNQDSGTLYLAIWRDSLFYPHHPHAITGYKLQIRPYEERWWHVPSMGVGEGGGLSADKKNGRSHANIQTKQQLRSNAPITVKVRGGWAVHRMGIWTIALAWGRAFESSYCSGRRDILNFRSRLWPQIISWVGEFQLYLTSHFCLGVRNLTAIFGKMSKSHPDRQDMFIWSLVQ